MTLTIIFAVSGLVIALLLVAKMWEIENKKSFLLLRLISKGDSRIRVWSHNATHEYSVLKEKSKFFFNQQLPLRLKTFLSKTEAQIKELSEKHLAHLRNTRLLKSKDGGLEGFLKNMSNKEKDDNMGEVSEE